MSDNHSKRHLPEEFAQKSGVDVAYDSEKSARSQEKNLHLSSNLIEQEAGQLLNQMKMYFKGREVGTVAARDPSAQALNYDQCFIRDFVSAALWFLLKGDTEIVRNFLQVTLTLQIKHKPRRGLMTASYKVVKSEDGQEYLQGDYGDHAIARVTPVDSCLWWVFLLWAYVKVTKCWSLAHQKDFQEGIRLIMELCLGDRFENCPTLLVPDASFMIDRRMGVAGYPLEIQVLFYVALRAASELLVDDDLVQDVKQRLRSLTSYIRQHYHLDSDRLNAIYRYPVEEYGEKALNQYNIFPDSIPYDWLTEWLPRNGVYLAGNIGPSYIDCRFFAQGNLMAIISSLTTVQQSQGIMNLIETRWDDLVGEIPMKICFPALEGLQWQLITGCDPKNIPWSYHNSANWPVLIWPLVAAALKTGREKDLELAQKAIDIAENRLVQDEYPEYYDGRNGRLIGKQARKFQTWTISGFLLAKELMNNPNHLALISFDRDPDL